MPCMYEPHPVFLPFSMSRTLVALASLTLATVTWLAVHPATVAGRATMAPQACTTYESAIMAASLTHGQTVRLACVDGQPV